MRKEKLIKKILSFILVLVLVLGFTTVAYANDELSEMYNSLFIEYSISGTVIDKNNEAVLVELDNPISSQFSFFDIKYAYVKGSWNESIGDKFNPTIKFQMFDFEADGYIIIGIFEQSIGVPNITIPEEYISDEDTQYMLDWMTAAAVPFSENGDYTIYYNGYAIDEEGPIEEGMDMTLLRLYVNNPGYMYIGMEPPIYNEYDKVWIYPTPVKMIQDFRNVKNTIEKNGTYYFPMKEVIEYYGHSVSWTQETGVIISNYLQITSNSNIVKNLRDGIDITLSNNIEIIDGTTYVPIEFLQKAFPENGFKWTTQDRGHGCISIDITQEIAG